MTDFAHRFRILGLLTALLFGGDRLGQAHGDEPPAAGELPAWMIEIMNSGAFLAHHPDVRNQQNGLRAYREGRKRDALAAFRRGAHFADKASQAMLAQMHWHGEGVPVDRAAAYAWMDLAAERGYPVFLVEREKMWDRLQPEERERAIATGTGLYARYGDQAARPRLERTMRIGLRRSVTGSRTGYDAGVRIAQPRADGSLDAGGGASATASVFDPRWWTPEGYWQVQDQIWGRVPRPEIIVHPLQPDPGPPEPVADED